MSEQTPIQKPLVSLWLVRAHLMAAMIAATISLLAGFAYSLQFLDCYPFEGIELLSAGRVRLVHTSLIAYGFLFNGFIGGTYYAIPRLCGVRVLSEKLGKLAFWVWQAIMTFNVIGLLLGKCQAVEWGETPTGFRPGTLELNYLPIDALIAVAAVIVIAQFYWPMFKARNAKHMYVTQWYLMVGFIWLALTYLMGNILPEWFLPGASGAAVGGLFIHDLVGLFVTPFGWGLMYFFVPVILRKPIWSHWLSVIGFWALAFFYPLNGVHHFLLSPIPDFVEFGAVISTIGVEIVVTTVVVNFFMTMVGRGYALRSNMPIRWFYIGMVFYFLTCLQCAWHTTWTAQEIIHFSDWVVGHAHLVMFGVFGHWVIGMTVYLWPRVTGKEWYSRTLLAWHFWLSAIGIVAMFITLTLGGLVMGYAQMNLTPWMQIVASGHAFWVGRTISGLMIVAGIIIFLFNMIQTVRLGEDYDARVDELVLEETAVAAAA